MRTPNSQSKHDQLRAKIVQVWRDRGHTEATIAHYLKCVERYRSHCLRLGVEEIGRLTRRSVDRFARAYARRRGRNANQCVEEARSSLHAWARAAAVAGLHVPDWVPPGKPGPFDAELARYCEFGRRWRGVKESTLDRESEVISCFLKWLRQHRQPLSSITLKIIDEFLVEIATTSAPITIAGVCSRLRSFLRFLHATDVLSIDLSSCVVAPLTRRHARLPPVVPWRDVCRLLRAIDRRTALGKRDYATTLLMAAYGMGGAEVLALRLDDVNWVAGTLRVVRPKTGVETILPLLGPVGRALASYLRNGRPRRGTSRALFVRCSVPHVSFGIDALRARMQRHAATVGVPIRFFSPHALRRSHASRQIAAAAPPKVVSDILGHDDPRSISVYARVATERLREVCLPLP